MRTRIRYQAGSENALDDIERKLDLLVLLDTYIGGLPVEDIIYLWAEDTVFETLHRVIRDGVWGNVVNRIGSKDTSHHWFGEAPYEN